MTKESLIDKIMQADTIFRGRHKHAYLSANDVFDLIRNHNTAPDVVEAVAKAICDSIEMDCYETLPPNGIIKAAYQQQAKAAIAAMGDASTRKDEGNIGKNSAATYANVQSTSPANTIEISLLDKVRGIKSPFDDSYILRKDALSVAEEHGKATAYDTRCSDCPCRFGIHCEDKASPRTSLPTICRFCKGLDGRHYQDCAVSKPEPVSGDDWKCKKCGSVEWDVNDKDCIKCREVQAVSVSLERFAYIIDEGVRRDYPGKFIAKAVLDEAGVKYE